MEVCFRSSKKKYEKFDYLAKLMPFFTQLLCTEYFGIKFHLLVLFCIREVAHTELACRYFNYHPEIEPQTCFRAHNYEMFDEPGKPIRCFTRLLSIEYFAINVKKRSAYFNLVFSSPPGIH